MRCLNHGRIWTAINHNVLQHKDWPWLWLQVLDLWLSSLPSITYCKTVDIYPPPPHSPSLMPSSISSTINIPENHIFKDITYFLPLYLCILTLATDLWSELLLFPGQAVLVSGILLHASLRPTLLVLHHPILQGLHILLQGCDPRVLQNKKSSMII